tara:strand:- start:1566 stop:2171 length:606 start_codon:yes stop_codon:yes gene_type:complete
MSLSQHLIQFQFDLETSDLLQNEGRDLSDVRSDLHSLGFNNSLLDLMLNNRRLLNSVLLRLQLYSNKNLSENEVRNNLSKLNNNFVNELVNHLFSTNNLENSVSVPVVELNNNEDTISDTEEVNNIEVNDETVLLNNFFNECICVTEDATDIVRSSEFYNALSGWWSNQNVDIPDKKVLKNYLNDRLGKSSKNTWTKVSLN